MHRQFILWTVICLMTLSIAGYTGQTHAQEGSAELSEEQQTSLERVITALESQSTYSSYVETVNETRELEISVISIVVDTAADEDTNIDQTSTTNLAIERTSYVVQEDGQRNVQSMVQTETAATSVAPPNFNQTIEYGVDAELRLVDDTVYIRGNFQDPEAASAIGFEPMPRTWIIPDNFEDWEQFFWDIRPTYYTGSNGINSIFLDNEDLLVSLISDVQVETATPEDETPVDNIIITLTGDGLNDVVSTVSGIEKSHPFFPAFFTENDEIIYTFSLDEDNVLRQLEITINTRNNVNLNQIDPRNLSGMLAFARTTFNRTVTYTDINAPRNPIPAPQVPGN